MASEQWWDLFLAACDRWGDDWRRFATKLTGNEADADDLVGEAILHVIDAEPPISSERGFLRFTLKTIKNGFIDRQRGRQRRRKLFEILTREGRALASRPLRNLADIGDSIDQERLADAALRHLDELPDNLREAITLYFFSGDRVTYREVVEAMHVSRSTAHGYVQEGLALLERALRDEFDL